MPSRTRPTSSPSATPTARTSPGPPTTTWRRPTSFMSPATCSRSSALSPRSAACSPPPMTAAPVQRPYAVLSWDYWNHRFGRDPHVLGRSLHIGDQTFEIIGVGPRDFTGTEKGTVTDVFLPVSMNRFANQDRRQLAPHLPDVETRRQPGHRPRAAPPASLRRQPRLRGRVLQVLPRHDPGVHRPLSQSEARLQSRRRRHLRSPEGLSPIPRRPRSPGRSRPAHRLRQRRQHDDRPGRRPRPGDGSPNLDRRRPSSPRPAHPVPERAARPPGFRPWRILCGVVGALCAQPRQSARQPCAPRPSRRLACASLRLRAHYPRRSIAWFASCSPCLCRPARRRPQRW